MLASTQPPQSAQLFHLRLWYEHEIKFVTVLDSYAEHRMSFGLPGFGRSKYKKRLMDRTSDSLDDHLFATSPWDLGSIMRTDLNIEAVSPFIVVLGHKPRDGNPEVYAIEASSALTN